MRPARGQQLGGKRSAAVNDAIERRGLFRKAKLGHVRGVDDHCEPQPHESVLMGGRADVQRQLVAIRRARDNVFVVRAQECHHRDAEAARLDVVEPKRRQPEHVARAQHGDRAVAQRVLKPRVARDIGAIGIELRLPRGGMQRREHVEIAPSARVKENKALDPADVNEKVVRVVVMQPCSHPRR
eukprot:Amastigsp_a851383_15.p2 type:complete len:184 gc:universal Amastigsp_a851383_15:563-1114(+)